MDISKHPILKQAYDLSQAIEACGCSEELTNATVKASELAESIDELIGDKNVLDEALTDACNERDEYAKRCELLEMSARQRKTMSGRATPQQENDDE